MAEREVEVSAVSAGTLQLRLLGTQCEGCSGGCAGRCNLFATADDGRFHLATPAGLSLQAGQRLRLSLDDRALRLAAWRGYGLAWLGLVLGAAAGHAMGAAWPGGRDLCTLVGLVTGTFVAVRFSKRHLPEPRLLPPAPDTSPSHSMSDSP